MSRFPLPLGRQAGAARAPIESVERLLNGYLESAPSGKEPTPIYGTPGLLPFASGFNGSIRGVAKMNGVPYVVMGSRLYSVASDGTYTDLGAIPNTDLVSMDADGINVVIVTAGSIYVWNQAGGVQLVTDPDAPDAASVVFIDGFFLFVELNTQQFFICALSDPLTYDALDFSSAEWKPDLLVSAIVLHRTVFMMGAETMEAQQNTGAAAFPFQRYQDIFVTCGIAGRFSAVVSNDALFWLANDYTVRRLDGLSATPISTSRINRLIKAWTDPSLTVASAHVLDEHLFIVFRNPDGCIVYDQTTQLWHERASYGSTTWRVSHLFDAFGKTLAGSASLGKLYSLDVATYDEDGTTLEFETVTPFLYSANKLLTVMELEVVAETGGAAAGASAFITAERTKDGQRWSPRKSKSLGLIGQYLKRVLFGPQGQARQFAWRIRITDPVRRAILGVYAEADVET